MNYSFELHESLYGEARESWVWLPKRVGENIQSGDIIKICHNDNSIILEARIVDKYFERRFKNKSINFDNAIFLNENYRVKLGLSTEGIDKEIKFQIQKTINPYNIYFKYFIQHPRAEVRLTCYLASFSICIGLISIISTLKFFFHWLLQHICNC